MKRRFVPMVSNPWREAIEVAQRQGKLDQRISFQSLEGGY